MTDPQTETQQKLIAELRLGDCESDINRTCRKNWPTDPASWCYGCQTDAAADALDALAAEIATLRAKLAEAKQREAKP